MKIRNIVLGGQFISLYIVISYIFAADMRQIQTIVIIIKILVVAYYAYNTENRERIVFGLGAMLASMMYVPLSIAVTYNIPGIVLGIALGSVIKWNKKIIGWILYVVLNTFFILYELLLYQFFLGGDVSLLGTLISFNEENNSILFLKAIKIAAILYIIVNSTFSASLTYFIVYKFLHKIKFLKW